jgi:hypothetical protein
VLFTTPQRSGILRTSATGFASFIFPCKLTLELFGAFFFKLITPLFWSDNSIFVGSCIFMIERDFEEIEFYWRDVDIVQYKDIILAYGIRPEAR